MPKPPASVAPDAAAPRARVSAIDVARDLRRRIQSGDLLPGAWLREIKLAQQLETGRSAIREALRILEKDGLVEIVRFRGARVTTPTADELFDLFEVRAALFGLVARFACYRASDADLAVIAERIERLVADADQATAEARVKEGVEIGAMITRHANRDAREMMNASHRKARWHFSYLELQDHSYQPLNDWRDLADGLRARDAEGAANAARRVIHFVQQEVIKSLAERNAALV